MPKVLCVYSRIEQMSILWIMEPGLSLSSKGIANTKKGKNDSCVVLKLEVSV